MSENQVFTNTPLETGDWDSYTEPREQAAPPIKGQYTAKIVAIRELKTEKGFEATLDYRIVGGQYDDTLLTFQRISSQVRKRLDGVETSTLTDILKAAGEERPTSTIHAKAIIERMVNKATVFNIDFDWRAFCATCYSGSLIKQTHATTEEEAKRNASKDQRKNAGKVANLANSYTKFPLVTGIDGVQRRQPFILCKGCATEVNAQGNIQRYVKVSKAAPAATVVAPPAIVGKSKEEWF